MPYNVLRKPVLIIDPGHGGKDPGALSRYGREEDWTLKISLYQYERFQELSVPVVISRTTDMDLEENERVSTVINSGAQYCISNHLNAGGGDRAEVIHSMHDDGKLANRIKEQLLVAGQNAVKVYFRQGSNGKDYYYMHRRTGAVKTNIVEYAFIDNEADFKHFEANWKAYAEAVVMAFCSHIGHPYKPVQEAVKVANKTDYAGSTFEESIKKAMKKGVIKGYDDNTFKPNDPLTRGQMAAILDRLKLLD
jgi:N-acetylmuramoyl-L-alanine amidase